LAKIVDKTESHLKTVAIYASLFEKGETRGIGNVQEARHSFQIPPSPIFSKRGKTAIHARAEYMFSDEFHCGIAGFPSLKTHKKQNLFVWERLARLRGWDAIK
jgi:hypothetical protein